MHEMFQISWVFWRHTESFILPYLFLTNQRVCFCKWVNWGSRRDVGDIWSESDVSAAPSKSSDKHILVLLTRAKCSGRSSRSGWKVIADEEELWDSACRWKQECHPGVYQLWDEPLWWQTPVQERTLNLFLDTTCHFHLTSPPSFISAPPSLPHPSPPSSSSSSALLRLSICLRAFPVS